MYWHLCPQVSAVTPLQAEQFVWELWFHPDWQKGNFVLDGLCHGFQVGFSPAQKLKSAKKNKASAAQHPSVVDQYLASEVSLGRVAGPFSVPPYLNLHVSSFGIILPQEAYQGSGTSLWNCGPFLPREGGRGLVSMIGLTQRIHPSLHHS